MILRNRAEYRLILRLSRRGRRPSRLKLTITPQAPVGYEMVDSQRGA